jgi:surfeit locus 1 family protein
MAAAQSTKGLSLGGQAFFGSLCVGTFGLGVWQTQRYFEKVELVEKRQRDLSMDPVPLESYEKLLKTDNFCRLQLSGRFDHRREFLVGPRGPPPGALPDRPGSAAAGMTAAPQGYYVITPFLLKDTQKVVLVNRGWLPRQLVAPQRRTMSPSSSLLQWDRPEEVQNVLTVVPSKPEKPSTYLVAQHDFESKPPRLFWLDRVAMHAAAGLPFPDDDDESTTVPIVTAVREVSSADATTWPIQPPADKVGDFRVTPPVHVGYAFTWYGLSVAGTYMTRVLMRRG